MKSRQKSNFSILMYYFPLPPIKLNNLPNSKSLEKIMQIMAESQPTTSKASFYTDNSPGPHIYE